MAAGEPTVYVPTLDGGERLAACLESLRRQTVPAAVVVADNGAGDGCLELIETRFPEVERVGFGENLGFGRALNRAIAGKGGGPVILLNDDAVARPDFVEALSDKGGAEMTAAVLLDREDQSLIDSAGVAADQTLMGFDYLSGEPVSALDGARAPLGPTGGAAMYDRSAFDAVGGFDERIFLYYEDLDLALRIRAAGGRCRLAGSARATHGYSQTLGAGSGRKYAMTGWSRGYLARRYRVAGHPSGAVSTLLREAAICSGQLLRDHTTAGLRGRLRGWSNAGGLPARQLPPGAVTRMSARQALALRHGSHAGP